VRFLEGKKGRGEEDHDIWRSYGYFANENKTRTIGAKSTNPDITRKVTLNYALAATSAFSQLAKKEGRKFRFVFVSGFLAVKDQNAPFVLFGTSRKVAVCSHPPICPLLASRVMVFLIQGKRKIRANELIGRNRTQAH
jgi:hypothetical protein